MKNTFKHRPAPMEFKKYFDQLRNISFLTIIIALHKVGPLENDLLKDWE
jgi:hypothetical protein